MDIFLPRPIYAILEGNKNYLSWSQVMCSFLKDHMLWQYYAGIFTWIQNTSISSVSNLLGSFDDVKFARDTLAKR